MAAAMAPKEYRSALKEIGYSQAGFAKFIGASPRTGQKWALGEARIPNPVAILLRLFVAHPKMLKVVEAMTPLPTMARVEGKRARRIKRKAA